VIDWATKEAFSFADQIKKKTLPHSKFNVCLTAHRRLSGGKNQLDETQ
jgi:L-ribulose-5-phosphate 3-epimerase UlaE